MVVFLLPFLKTYKQYSIHVAFQLGVWWEFLLVGLSVHCLLNESLPCDNWEDVAKSTRPRCWIFPWCLRLEMIANDK